MTELPTTLRILLDLVPENLREPLHEEVVKTLHEWSAESYEAGFSDARNAAAIAIEKLQSTT